MSNPEQPPEQPPAPRPSRVVSPSAVALIPRLGNIQGVVEYRGEGVYRRPVVRFTKLIPAEVLRADPSMMHWYEAEEIATLRALCDFLLRDFYNNQTLVPQEPAMPPVPIPGQPVERPPVPAEPPAPAPQAEPPKAATRKGPSHRRGGRR